MRVVGLTGGIASGKSSVSKFLQEFGIPVIDADEIAHTVSRKGSRCHSLIAKQFGSAILQSNGEIDRKKLGETVFTDPSKRKVLNKIIQPYIGWGMFKNLAFHWIRGTRVVVLDAPLLFEAKIEWLTNPIVVVSCNVSSQLSRLMERNSFTEKQAMARIDAQFPLELKVKRADIVIDNSGNFSDLEGKVKLLASKLTSPLSFKEYLRSRSFFGITVAFMAVFFSFW